MFKKNPRRRFYDYSLLFSVIFLTAFGLIMIYSASYYTSQVRYDKAPSYFMMHQLAVSLPSLVLMVIVSKIDYHIYEKLAWSGYILSYVFMGLVSFFGKKVNGKRRWLGYGKLQFQPTEFAKLILILLLAMVIVKMGNKINTLRGICLVLILTAPIAALVAANNLSSGIIIMGIAFVMLFVSCKIRWPFFLCGFTGLAVLKYARNLLPILELFLQPYQLDRIYVWLDPEAYPMEGGFQVRQGLYAIGSGGLLGKGLGEGIQKLGFVPEPQNDMIFSIICEELGFFGAVSVILLFMFLIYRLMLIAQNAPDLMGALIAVGVLGHIAIQVILNIAVVTNTIPNTGITLPFISYGGTSVLFLMVEVGIALNVSSAIKLQ